MPSSACCLQYAAFLLPSKLKPGRLVQEPYEQRLCRTSTMPSSACCLQYTGILLPSTLKHGRLMQGSREQLLLRTSTMPSVACSLQYAAPFFPLTLKFGCLVQASWEQRPILAEYCGGSGLHERAQDVRGLEHGHSPLSPAHLSFVQHTVISTEFEGLAITKLFHF